MKWYQKFGAWWWKHWTSIRAVIVWTIIGAVISILAGIAIWPQPEDSSKRAEDSGPTGGGTNKIEIRFFDVPPSFASSSGPPVDPFAPSTGTPVPLPKRPSAKEVLEEVGVIFPVESGAAYSPSSSTLAVWNTPNQLDLIEAYVSPLGGDYYADLVLAGLQVFKVPLSVSNQGDFEPVDLRLWEKEGKAEMVSRLNVEMVGGMRSMVREGERIEFVSNFAVEDGVLKPKFVRAWIGAEVELELSLTLFPVATKEVLPADEVEPQEQEPSNAEVDPFDFDSDLETQGVPKARQVSRVGWEGWIDFQLDLSPPRIRKEDIRVEGSSHPQTVEKLDFDRITYLDGIRLEAHKEAILSQEIRGDSVYVIVLFLSQMR